MITLSDYRNYWERMAMRVPGITDTMAATIDDEMGRKIQNMKIGSVTLFYLPPAGQSDSADPDNFKEKNQCVIFVMEKYDPQRCRPFEVLESSQAHIEAIKSAMVGDMATGCHRLRFDLRSLNTMPETKFYAGFAGWSLGFNIIS